MNATDKKCNRCFFGTCIDNNRYKCHVSRPTSTTGFPKVNASDYCSYWTDPVTMDRPFFYPLSGAHIINQAPVCQKGGVE